MLLDELDVRKLRRAYDLGLPLILLRGIAPGVLGDLRRGVETEAARRLRLSRLLEQDG